LGRPSGQRRDAVGSFHLAAHCMTAGCSRRWPPTEAPAPLREQDRNLHAGTRTNPATSIGGRGTRRTPLRRGSAPVRAWHVAA
jgi:hypothetical protein